MPRASSSRRAGALASTSSSTVYPINATRDSLFGNTEVFNGVSNIFPSFKLTGLDTQTVYSFSFYASRTGVGEGFRIAVHA